MSKHLFAAAAALAVIATAPATARTQNGQEGAADGAQKKERKVCRTFENSASRLKAKRICLTKAQWKRFEAAQ